MTAPSIDQDDAAAGAGRPPPPTGRLQRNLALVVLLAVAAYWSISGLDISLERLLTAPHEAPVSRLDEARAARQRRLRFDPDAPRDG